MKFGDLIPCIDKNEIVTIIGMNDYDVMILDQDFDKIPKYAYKDREVTSLYASNTGRLFIILGRNINNDL